MPLWDDSREKKGVCIATLFENHVNWSKSSSNSVHIPTLAPKFSPMNNYMYLWSSHPMNNCIYLWS
jgi:hypothetical protein